MDIMKDKDRVESLKGEANSAKNRLIRIMHELEELNANREAKTLRAIIGRLEAWQNK